MLFARATSALRYSELAANLGGPPGRGLWTGLLGGLPEIDILEVLALGPAGCCYRFFLVIDSS